MLKKWYFGFFITALAFLVIAQHDAVVSNQEIVLEFVNTDITSHEALEAISQVKEQLKAIGAKNTRVAQGKKNGTLKITYYSDSDIACIKSILSKEQKTKLDHLTFDHNQEEQPLEGQSKKYNLDVYEIQNSPDSEVNFNGIALSETQQGSVGFSKANDFQATPPSIISNHLEILVKVAHKKYASTTITLEATSHNIPEVRAGPLS